MKNLREAIQQDLEDAGIRCAAYLPERFAPPIAIVSPSDPYIVPDEIYGALQANFEVLLIAGTAANSVVTGALDDMTTSAISALYDIFVSASAPVILEANNAQYLSTQLNVTMPFKI